MNSEVIRDFLAKIPANINYTLECAFCLGVWWLWKNVLKPFLVKYRDKQKAENAEQIRRLDLATQSLVDIYHSKLLNTKRKCYRKGYRTDYDTNNFELIYHKYKQLGGNTDGDDIKKDFLKLECPTVLEIKERLGVDNPTNEYMQAVVDFFNLSKTGVVSEQDTKEVIEFVNKKRQKKDVKDVREKNNEKETVK